MGRKAKLKQLRKQARLKQAQQEEKAKKIGRYLFLGIVAVLLIGVGTLYFTLRSKPAQLGQASSEQTADLLAGTEGEAPSPAESDVESSNQPQPLTTKHYYDHYPEMKLDQTKQYFATLKTNYGDIKIELFPQEAPLAVNNFIFLAQEKFYNGLTFHRVIKDFMLQGGDPKGDGTGSPGYKFDDEFFSSRQLVRGSLAMANSGPNTNGSQFFIVTKEATPWLDGKHTNFGQVVGGIEVVMAIEKVKTDEFDKPEKPVVINEVVIEEL